MLQKVNFRLTSVAQKRCCLSSLLTSVVPYCFLIACLHQVLSRPQCQHRQVLQLHQGKILPYRGRVKMPSVLDFITRRHLQWSGFKYAMTAELKKWRRNFYRLSLHLHKFQQEEDLFITLYIVYSQISTLTCRNFWIFYFTSKLTLYEWVVNVCIQR